MAASFRDMERKMVVLARDISVNSDRLVRAVALVIDQTLVLGTPVDTGLARSNWLVSIGSPRDDVIAPYSPGNRLGINEGANAQGALQQGQDVIAQYRKGQVVFITNNVFYVDLLDQGHSQQAPEGFVDMALQAGVATIGKFSLVKRV